MSRFLKSLRFLTQRKETFSNGFGVTSETGRGWEGSYRGRWNYDKIVRSTHGVNCTGSCSWKIYVKNGIITWETQQTDYPSTASEYPNHEPRGCARGASYSWYVYSSNRIRHPRIRTELLSLWREARKTHSPVEAWEEIQKNPAARESYVKARGKSGFVRLSWTEANEIIAAANIYTIKKYGPDRLIGFSPIPAMSQVSYAGGSRYLSLLGGNCLSFYDWYCDLPPSSPQVIGDQTDAPESLDWYNAAYLIAWGSNLPMTRTPDCHFFTESRYNGTETVVISPDYAEASKFADLWLHPERGTDAALGFCLNHVVMREFFLERQSPYFLEYASRYTDLPFLVLLEEAGGETYKAGRFLRAADLSETFSSQSFADWKSLVWNQETDQPAIPRGTAGARWEQETAWNLEPFDSLTGEKLTPALSFSGKKPTASSATVRFAYMGHKGSFGLANDPPVQSRKIPCKTITLKNGASAKVATVFDLLTGSLGLDAISKNFPDYGDAEAVGTPAWQEKITGIPARQALSVARGFALNAEKTRGKSMIIVGAGLNHWYNMDMSYRMILNLCMLCGCIGQNGGGWAHYVGQEKLRPMAGWSAIAFAKDWGAGARCMNGTSFWYMHSNQWRYETNSPREQVSPLEDSKNIPKTFIDCNTQAERLGWLPSAPQLNQNPLDIAQKSLSSGKEASQYVRDELLSGRLKMANQDPDAPQNWPRNLFVWRSNLLGTSAKGVAYFFEHLVGSEDGSAFLHQETSDRPDTVKWHEKAPKGKLDLITTLDFRMTTTALFSDIVLPSATWYEKNDLNTSDMHTFIHPLQAAADPAWESKADWVIFRDLAETFQKLSFGHLGEEKEILLSPLAKDTPAELAQPYGGKDWLNDKTAPAIPGKTMPKISLVTRYYNEVFDRFITLGKAIEEQGCAERGSHWETKDEISLLRKEHPSLSKKYPAQASLFQDTDAISAILTLAPETNGAVAKKAWQAESQKTSLNLEKYLEGRENERLHFEDIIIQPKRVLNGPASGGIGSEKQAYAASWLNIHANVPFRTLTGRLQFYLDHPWMRAFGAHFATYRPPLKTSSTPHALLNEVENGQKVLTLNLITPHQKWGIHSTYSDNWFMLNLSRGGPAVWISEEDALKAEIKDNDWIEAFNVNGTFTARAIVSQRIPNDTCFFYHGHERLVSTPGSEITKKHAGVLNSATRIAVNPTHMIGGYAQCSYAFNYYGPVGSTRDEFIFLRKMKQIDWLEN